MSRRSVGGQAGNLFLSGVRAGFDYSLWDSDKHQMCVCDPGFEGIDCSQRSCPRGDDPLTPSTARWCGGKACKFEVQQFVLSSAVTTTYKFSFVDGRNQSLVAYFTVDTSTGVPGAVATPDVSLAGPSTNAGIIMNALRGIPGGGLQLAEVRALGGNPASDGDLVRTFQITFSGLSGNQYMLILEKVQGPGDMVGVPTEVTQGNMEDLECSGRGVCDRSGGLCGCFAGYFGVAWCVLFPAIGAGMACETDPFPLPSPCSEYQNALTAGTTGATAGVVSSSVRAA
jgi:hypothetical protein